MLKQPTPTVTADDVERIVHRDFAQEQFAAVMEILSEYGTQNWHRECPRVQLAVLKLAGGNLKDLRRYIEAAKSDYRDVLAGAEYPAYFRQNVFASEAERQKIIESDWHQYETWLNRNAD
jgi:hypothetical protein